MSEGIEEASQGELACTVVTVALAAHMASDRANINQVIAARSFLSPVLDAWLVLEEKDEVDVRLEVDIHCQFDLLNGQFVNTFANTSSSIVDQYMNLPVLRCNTLPHSLNFFGICQVNLIEMDSCKLDVT